MSLYRKWYWRMVMSMATGTLIFSVGILIVRSGYWYGLLNLINDLAEYVIVSIRGPRYTVDNELLGIVVIFWLLSSLPAMIATLFTYQVLSAKYAGLSLDGEIHCRNCRYILRGITEPRCPECGEAI